LAAKSLGEGIGKVWLASIRLARRPRKESWKIIFALDDLAEELARVSTSVA